MRNGVIKRAIGWVAVMVPMAAVIWFYSWTVSSSGGFGPPGEEDYYNFMVQGWRQGHLYMTKEPRPEMLALKDPYDPAQNGGARLADASYYKRHYYLYFGAVPAAFLLLPYGVITGKEMGTTTAIFLYCSAGFLAMSGIWLAFRARYFPKSAIWTGPLGVLVLGLSSHVLALERRPLVWELPIAAGFAFSMLALAAVYYALHGRRVILACGLAGLSLGLAIGSRPTWILGGAAFIPVLWSLRRLLPNMQRLLACSLALVACLSVCIISICAYNYARFDNPIEFGQSYQLSGIYESRARHFSLSYLTHNFYIYFLHPGTWSKTFPFVCASAVRGGPDGYLGEWNEGICGVAVTFPFLWLALFVPLAARSRTNEERTRIVGTLAAIVGFCVVMTAVIFCYFIATPRYLRVPGSWMAVRSDLARKRGAIRFGGRRS